MDDNADSWMMYDPNTGRMLAMGTKKDIVALSDEYMKEVEYRETLKFNLKKDRELKREA